MSRYFPFVEATDAPSVSHVYLGHLECKGEPGATSGAVTAWVQTYGADVQGTLTGYHHPDFGHGPGGPILAPTPQGIPQTYSGTWAESLGLLRVTYGGKTRLWKLRDPFIGEWVQTSPWAGPGVKCYGYGRFSDALVGPTVTPAQLGVLYQGNSRETILGNWQAERWTDFKPHAPQFSWHPPILGYNGPPDQGMKVYGSLVLAGYHHSSLMATWAEGHDYSKDGIYNDLGHTLTLFGCWSAKDAKVNAYVGVQQSFDVSGHAILGIYHWPCLDDWAILKAA